MFNLFKKIEKEKKTLEIHNRLIDIRIGRKYARGDNMNGNTYECLNTTAEEVYNHIVESSDDLKDVNKEYFIEGYDLQKKELSDVVTKHCQAISNIELYLSESPPPQAVNDSVNVNKSKLTQGFAMLIK